MSVVQLPVTPMSRGHRVVLHIHPTLAALRAHTLGKTTLGATLAYTGGTLAAEVHVAATHIRLYVLAHEAVHVAYALRRRFCQRWAGNAEHSEEEHLAYPVGEITESMVVTLEKHGYQVKTSK